MKLMVSNVPTYLPTNLKLCVDEKLKPLRRLFCCYGRKVSRYLLEYIVVEFRKTNRHGLCIGKYSVKNNLSYNIKLLF